MHKITNPKIIGWSMRVQAGNNQNCGFVQNFPLQTWSVFVKSLRKKLNSTEVFPNEFDSWKSGCKIKMFFVASGFISVFALKTLLRFKQRIQSISIFANKYISQ
jgi:hypothetical protein